MPADTEVRYHQCTICEAACGLELEVSGREVVSIRGDAQDAFSHGFVCPKGAALRELDADPDRLRQPLVKRDGVHVPVSWDEAFEEIERGLRPLIAQHGNDAVAFYLGNPGAHSTALLLYNQALLTGFRSRNRYSASTVDQYPKQVAVGLMFGTGFSVPVPDIDRSRVPADARRQSDGVERHAVDGARLPRPRCAACASAAAARRRGSAPQRDAPRSPTSTSRCARAPTRCCSRAWCTRSSRRSS
jgi:hypothetical protein